MRPISTKCSLRAQKRRIRENNDGIKGNMTANLSGPSDYQQTPAASESQVLLASTLKARSRSSPLSRFNIALRALVLKRICMSKLADNFDTNIIFVFSSRKNWIK